MLVCRVSIDNESLGILLDGLSVPTNNSCVYNSQVHHACLPMLFISSLGLETAELSKESRLNRLPARLDR